MKKVRKYRDYLDKYINQAALSRFEIFLSMISVKLIFQKRAKYLIQLYQNLFSSQKDEDSKNIEIRVKLYGGRNFHVEKMRLFLNKYLENDLIGAYVHGSLATSEEVVYSDFDALVIIKDEVFSSSKRLANVAYHLFKAQSIMFAFDPLQHHGWFVLTESDLKDYPEEYIPAEVLRHAKSLLRDRGLTLTIHLPAAFPDMGEAFNIHCLGLLQLLSKRRFPRNLYQLKGLFSQFMLLPALYIQARDKKGIYKKDSFASAKKDFSAMDWSIMDEVSSLRQQWACRISPWRRWLLTKSPIQISRSFAYRFAPAILPPIREKLSIDFFERMRKLVETMEGKLRLT